MDSQELAAALFPFAALGALLDCHENDQTEAFYVWVGDNRCSITLAELAKARRVYEQAVDRGVVPAA